METTELAGPLETESPAESPADVPQAFRSSSSVDESCWVYVMAAGKFVKVGIAADVDRRLCNIRSGPLETELVAKRRMPNRVLARAAEAAIHLELKRYHHRREWFIVSRDRARALMSRNCARIRLESFLEDRRPISGIIRLAELLEPTIPQSMKNRGLLEQWQWKRARATAYYDAIERGELEVD